MTLFPLHPHHDLPEELPPDHLLIRFLRVLEFEYGIDGRPEMPGSESKHFLKGGPGSDVHAVHGDVLAEKVAQADRDLVPARGAERNEFSSFFDAGERLVESVPADMIDGNIRQFAAGDR